MDNDRLPVRTVLFIILFALCMLCSCDLIAPSPGNYKAESAYVERAVDGDTVVLSSGERVRFVGINTPEKWEPYYKEATQALRDIAENKSVYLIRDVTNRDKYGRLLRYVFLEDDTLVNAEMVRGGYAKAYYYPPDLLYYESFEVLQSEAQALGIGIWNESLEAEDWTLSCPYVAAKTGAVYYASSCKYANRITAENRRCFDTASDAVIAGYRETKKC